MAGEAEDRAAYLPDVRLPTEPEGILPLLLDDLQPAIVQRLPTPFRLLDTSHQREDFLRIRSGENGMWKNFSHNLEYLPHAFRRPERMTDNPALSLQIRPFTVTRY
jgi:hypothetical protein